MIIYIKKSGQHAAQPSQKTGFSRTSIALAATSPSETELRKSSHYR
jgi:hypothetical protein